MNQRQNIIAYLKKEFRILPNAKDFDSIYLERLKKEKKSLEVDSLINSNLIISRYKPLNLDFITYYDDHYYKEKNSDGHYSLNFIQNQNTGKIYFDFIDWEAGLLIEDFCAYSGIKFNKKPPTVSEDDFKIYSNIKTNRWFQKWETYATQKSVGLETFLNTEFRFKKIGKKQLDSLFTFYDNRAYHNFNPDTLVANKEELVTYVARQAQAIKSRYHTEKDLISLKDQVNLVIATNSNTDTLSNFQWIYKNGHRLRSRIVSIKGSEKSFYSYVVDEKRFCF